MATYTSNLPGKGLQPMDPSSECLNTPHFCLSIIGIAESEIPIEVDKIMVPLRTDLMHVNPGFSSIVVRKNGKQWWKQVEVHFDDHIILPTFPQGLSPEAYTCLFDEYLSKIGVEQLPETRPLWELHIIKYPTRTAAGTLLFKMSHALGDGFSIMGAVFSVLKRADDSSLPLTFPSAKLYLEERKNDVWKRGQDFVSGCFVTVSDVVSSLMHTAFRGDSRSTVRSGAESVNSLPKHTTRIDFSLDDIGKIKTKLGVTVNDIVVGLIFNGIHSYTKIVDPNPIQKQKTGLVLLNTRMLVGYRSLEEMLKQKMWGNQFSFIHVPMSCSSKGNDVDLKALILEASKIIKRNKNSLAVHLNGVLLALMGRLGGSETVAKYLHSVLKNTSFTISNLVGPTEKLAIADHPINNLYFTVTGVPQSVIFLVMSYLGKLTVAISVEKEFIDGDLLASCMDDSFKKILEKI